jgi:adenylate cyclase
MDIKSKCTVMFADIVGSSGLYARYGDEQARNALSQCIALMSETCQRHGGTVIKTIGDEVMSRFDRADDAVLAACGIHRCLEHSARFEGIKLAAHIGLHCGLSFIVEGDVYGDAPNVAARMTAIAQSGQIITTQDTINCLSPTVAASARRYDRITPKGCAREMSIYQVLWEQENATRLLTSTNFKAIASACLHLSYRSQELLVTLDTPVVLIGRGINCTLVVEADLVSRIHARIEYRRGKFVLIDRSTNGTFIRPSEGQEVYLRREEMPLSGRGHISLGRAWRADNMDLVCYSEQPSVPGS